MIAQAGTSNIIKLADSTSTDHTPAPHVAREAHLSANLPYPATKPSTESLKDRSKLPSSAKQFGLKSAINSPKTNTPPAGKFYPSIDSHPYYWTQITFTYDYGYRF